MSMRVFPVSGSGGLLSEKLSGSSLQKNIRKIGVLLFKVLNGLGGHMIVGFLLGRALILGKMYPFVVPCLAVVGLGNPVFAVWTSLACAAGIFTRTDTDGLLLFAFEATICLILAVASRKLLSREHDMLTAPLMAFTAYATPKLAYLIQSRFVTAHELAIVGVEAAIVIVLTVLFMRIYHSTSSEVDFSAALVIVGGVLIGLKGLDIAGISLTGIVISYMVMILALASGSTAACTVGAVAGVVAGLGTTWEPAVVGVYALLGLLSGLFQEGKKAAIITAYLLGLLLIVTAVRDLPIDFKAGCIAASLFLFTPRSLTALACSVVSQFTHERPSRVEPPVQIVEDKLKKAAVLLKSMSEVLLEDAEDEMILSSGDINSLVSELAQNICQECSMCEACWVRGFYRTYKGMVDLFTISELTGETADTSGPIPDCRRREHLVEEANRLLNQYREQSVWVDRINESRETVSWQLSGLSEILDGLARDISDTPVFDEETEAEVEAHLRAIGIHPEDVSVIREGDTAEVTIFTGCCDTASECELTIAPAVSSCLGTPTKVISRRCPDRGGKFCTFTLGPERHLTLEIGSAQVTKTGQELCGDNFLCEEMHRGRYLLALCDGMGSGKQAYDESTNVLTLLRELLDIGMDRETAVNTLNSFLLLRAGRETFSTLDICVVDLFSGLTEFAKIGAPGSYLMRDGEVEVIKSSTPPVGILDELDVETISMVLKDGDCLVMVTDGLFEAQPDLVAYDQWISRALCQVQDAHPEDIANYLVNRAKNNIPGQIIDDMAVLCVKVHFARNGAN